MYVFLGGMLAGAVAHALEATVSCTLYPAWQFEELTEPIGACPSPAEFVQHAAV